MENDSKLKWLVDPKEVKKDIKKEIEEYMTQRRNLDFTDSEDIKKDSFLEGKIDALSNIIKRLNTDKRTITPYKVYMDLYRVIDL